MRESIKKVVWIGALERENTSKNLDWKFGLSYF